MLFIIYLNFECLIKRTNNIHDIYNLDNENLKTTKVE